MGDAHHRSGWRRGWPLALALLLAVAGTVAWLVLRRVSTPEEEWRRVVAPAGEPLSVVLVTVDTLRADRLRCYGGERVETPGFDRLAREGALFTSAASTVPFTLPAHSSILTGTYPPYHGVRENVGYRLDEEIPTLAGMLADAGYATAGFVSAFVLDRRWGIARGFATYFDDFELDETRRANLGSVQRDGAETVAEALAWLDTAPPAPHFLWLHLFDPHDPYEPPEPYRSLYPERPYDGEVAYVDSLVDRFREGLAERGLLERSLVIVTADHGEGLGSHRESFHGYFVYDSTVRVPLIVRAPGDRLAGRVIEAPVSHVDLAPTVLAAAGLPIPEHLQGRSLLPLLLGADGEAEREVYTESLYPLLHYGWSPLKALRSGRYKLIDAPRPELYDLAADPEERHDLAAERRDVTRELRRRLRSLGEAIEAGGSGRSAVAELDEETLEQLRALGYIAGRGEAADRGSSRDDAERADPKDKIELHQLIMRAQSELGGGAEEKAEARLREVLERDEEILDAHQMLGTLLGRRGEHAEALESFRRALAIDPDHKASLFGLAGAYRQLGKLEEAMVGFRRLAELDPGDRRAALAMARIHVERGERPEAVALLERLAERPEAPAGLLNQLGELLVEVGRAEEAARRFREAVARDERLAQPRFNLAVLLEEREAIDEAARLYEETIERAPGHYQAQFNLGRLRGRQGDPEAEQALYEAALESNPDFVRGYYYLAKLLMDRGQSLARAEELTRQGLAKDPESRTGPLGHYLLADILNRSGRQDEARLAVRRAREIERRGAGAAGRP